MNEVREGSFGPCVRGEHEDCKAEWVTTDGQTRYVCICSCHVASAPGETAE